MADPISAFESELLQKIQFKASSKVSIDAFLFKAFKFFDISPNGCLGKTDFFKAIAKCGVVVDTHNIDRIFEHYAGEDGKLNYKSFIEELLFREDEIESNASRLKQSNRNLQPNIEVHEPEAKSLAQSKRYEADKAKENLGESKIQRIYSKCETYSEVLDFIKRSIQSEGLGSLLSVAVKIKTTDTKRTHLISKKTLQSILPFLQADHLNIIYQELSQNGTEIDYSNLVYDLKGQVDENLSREIQNVFEMLDNRRQGEFPIAYMLSHFLSKREIDNFKKAVDLYSKFQGIDDGVFTEEDFNDYLGFLSFDFASPEHFKRTIISAFYEEDNRSVASQRSNRSRDFQASQIQNREEPNKSTHGDFRKNKEGGHEKEEHENDDHFDQFHEQLNGDDKKSVSRYSEVGKKEVPTGHLKEVESIILRMKKRLATKGTKGFLFFEKAMKNADLDKDTLLNFEEFKQVIKEQRIDITNTECNHIFDVFDEQGTGLISFPEFMFTLRGKMPEVRKNLSEKLWNQVKVTEETSNFAQLKHSLNFRNHPDVQNGRKYEEDLWKEIQQTILTIQELNGAPRCDTISRMEFEEYLQNLSLSVLDDKLFESILFNFWKLNTAANILDKYAGSRKLFDPSKNGYLMDHHRHVIKGGSVSQNAPFGTTHEPTNYLTEHQRL